MALRLVVLAALVVSSGVAARGSLPEPGDGTLRIEWGEDALSGSALVSPVDDDVGRRLLIAVPAGSVLRVDSAFVVTNPNEVDRRAEIRWEGTTPEVRAHATIGGAPASSLAIPAGERVHIGLVAEALGATGSGGNLVFALVG